MPHLGIGDITDFGILPIKQIVITSPLINTIDERVVIDNLLEGSSFSATPLTRPTERANDWILGYNIEIVARTAERPTDYFRSGFFLGGGAMMPQFVAAGSGDFATVTVIFGKGTTGLQTVPFDTLPVIERASSASFTLQGVSCVPSITSGNDGFLFGEIVIKGFIGGIFNASPFAAT